MLRYVRIEYAGSALGDGHLNGISLNHVGAGTIVEYLQVFDVLDDAIELYGGSVNLKHIVVSGFRDDGIDWTQGYSGTIHISSVIRQMAIPIAGLKETIIRMPPITNLEANPRFTT